MRKGGRQKDEEISGNALLLNASLHPSAFILAIDESM
jgi:hypothetical protein